MTRLFSLTLTVVACVLFGGVKQSLAANVLVNLSEDGTLSIVAQFDGTNGFNFSYGAIDIVPQNDVIVVSGQHGLPTILNGELQILEFPADQVNKIECQNIYWLRVFTIPDPLIADLTILSSGFTEVEIVGDAIPVTGTGTIVGDVAFIDGRSSGKLVVENVNVLGNFNISTGHGADGIFFARGELPGGPSTGAEGPVQILGNLTINTGHDGDTLYFGNGDYYGRTYVAGDVDVQMGQGFDFLGQLESLSTDLDSNVSISLGLQNPNN